MRIERVPLNAGALGHHADGGERRADAAVQIHGRFDDAPPGFRLLLGAAFEVVGPGHVYFDARACAVILTRLAKFHYTHMYYQIRALSTAATYRPGGGSNAIV